MLKTVRIYYKIVHLLVLRGLHVFCRLMLMLEQGQCITVLYNIIASVV